MQSREYFQLKYGKHKGHYKWDLALIFFETPNDTFFEMFGFNFVPRGELFDEAKAYLAQKDRLEQHLGKRPLKIQLQEQEILDAIKRLGERPQLSPDVQLLIEAVKQLSFAADYHGLQVEKLTNQLHELWENNSSDDVKALIWEMERKEYINK